MIKILCLNVESIFSPNVLFKNKPKKKKIEIILPITQILLEYSNLFIGCLNNSL